MTIRTGAPQILLEGESGEFTAARQHPGLYEYSTKLAMPRHSREVTKRERYDSVRRMRLESRHGTLMFF